MHHIRNHIVEDGYRASHMRADGGLIRHLRHERIISSREYEDILERLNPAAVPRVPGSSRSGQLEMVEEEPYSTYRDKKKKDRHDEPSRKKGSRR